MNTGIERLRALLEAQTGKRRIAVTGHDRADVDSAAACVLIQRLLDAWNVPCVIALSSADKQSRRVMARFGIEMENLLGDTQPDDALILVDHHRTTREGRVLACVDHHPTDFPPEYPYVRLDSSGACAVMALRMMQEAGVTVTQEDEKLAVSALYLDTIALRSTKVTAQEAAWGRSEAERLGLDIAWLEREGMGLRDMTLPPQELAMLGKKEYVFGGVRVLSTYVQTDEMTPARLAAILAVLRREILTEQAALWVYLVHDPVRGCTTEYDLTLDGQVRKTEYGFLASRGKDVMPRVEREMRKAGE